MPTYRNDSQNTVQIEKLNGDKISIYPGGQSESKHFIEIPGLVLISDEPLFNPSVKNEVVSFAAAEEKTVTIESGTDEVMVWQVSGCNVEIFMQAVSNIPAWTMLRNGLDGTKMICDKTFNKLILKSDGAGTCRVQQIEGKIS